MIGTKAHFNKHILGSLEMVEFRPKIILFGLIAGLISSIGISTLIVMVEKVSSVPAGAFYLVVMMTITHSHSYSIYMILAGLMLHFVAGSLIGVVMALPFAMREKLSRKTSELSILDKYAPLYGLCFGFALWLVLFVPITYSLILPALNSIKDSPMITQQDPIGRVAFLTIDEVLSMQNRIVIGALAFNMFYGLVAAIIINSLHCRYPTRADRDTISQVSLDKL